MIIISLWDWVLNIFLLASSVFIFVLSLFGFMIFLYIVHEIVSYFLGKSKIFNIGD